MTFPKYAANKNSGVAWLGEIPSHWYIGQSRRLFSLRNERARTDDEQLTASQKHGVIPQKVFMEIEGQKVVQVVLNPEILKHVEPGDFVISMRSFQGGIEYSDYRGCISSAYVMLIPKPDVHPPYYKYLLKSPTYIQALQSTTNLIRDGQALRYKNFTMVDLPVVPLGEQKAIASFLEVATSDIMLDTEFGNFVNFNRGLTEDQEIHGLASLDSATLSLIDEESVRTIELLQERRTALISAAVTGKIDVRDFASKGAA